MWFPVVGLCLGGLYAAMWLGLSQGVSSLSAVLLTVTIGFLITGGFHEDGLADTCDAMGGGYKPEDVLRILKDSRIGTFGTLGVVSVLAIRCSLLLEIDHVKGWILGQSLSRVAPVALLGILPYARRTDDASKSRDVARSGKIQAGIVCGFGLAITSLAIYGQWLEMTHALQLWGLVIVVTAVLGWRFQKRVGGLTGDFLGATQQITELAVLYMVVA